jgi:hypothetical protein
MMRATVRMECSEVYHWCCVPNRGRLSATGS